MCLGTFTGEALTNVRVSVRGQVHRASLKAGGWLVSILLQTHLWLLCNFQQFGPHFPLSKRRAWGQMMVIRLEVLWFSEGIPLWTVGERDWGGGRPCARLSCESQTEKRSV